MVDHDVWQVFHLLSILAHIGMMLAGGATFVSMSEKSLSNFDNKDLLSVNFHRTTKFVLTERQSPTYPWAVSAMAGLGTFMSITAFLYWLQISKLLDQGTENEYYFKQKVAFAANFIVQSTLSIADIAMGLAVGAKVSRSGDLVFPCVFAMTAGAVSLATAVVDVLRFNHYREVNKAAESDLIEFSDE